jgi:hypothetical protein
MAKLRIGEACSSTPGINAANASEGSFESSDYNHHNELSQNIADNLPDDNALKKMKAAKKKKKRDPRLDCPNFLAGRVPCACPEEDALSMDMEDDVVKKKPKLAVRCQVPSCGDDISHLKGYHQRHRVCLDCANSPKVILKDGPHRYCQQCGKSVFCPCNVFSYIFFYFKAPVHVTEGIIAVKHDTDFIDSQILMKGSGVVGGSLKDIIRGEGGSRQKVEKHNKRMGVLILIIAMRTVRMVAQSALV